MGFMPAPALTPHSWNRTGGSSVGGAAGQMGTKVSRSSRSLVIAGVATLIVAAGAGGFVIANNMGKSEISHVGAPNPLEETMSNDKAAEKPDPVPVKPDVKPDPGAAMGTAIKSDPATATKPDATKTATKTDASKTDASKTDAVKTTTTKTDPTKTAVKTSQKTDTPKSSSKTTPAKTTKTKPKDDGLFDDRH
jgi:hypothetical protein